MSRSLPMWRCCRGGFGFLELIDYVAGVHPRFDRDESGRFSGQDRNQAHQQDQTIIEGDGGQLHLALVMAIDARLLVLDEPTLGLDILFRKQFYDSLLNDYFDQSRTIVVTTHQVEEIQNVITDLMFINHGRIVLECSMEQFESRYAEVMVDPDHLAAAQATPGPVTRASCSGAASCFRPLSIRSSSRCWATSDAGHWRLVRRAPQVTGRRAQPPYTRLQ